MMKYGKSNIVSEICSILQLGEIYPLTLENSLLFLNAMRRCGIPGELHIYPHGVHGLSLGTSQTCDPAKQPHYVQPDVGNWLEMALRWLKQM